MVKTIVVFGATGHLGAYTSLALRDSGYNVVAVGRRLDDKGFYSKYGIKYIGGMYLEDGETLKKLNVGRSVDAVVNLAGAMPAHAGTSSMQYVQSIVAGIVNICEWMRRIQCRRIVFNTTPSDVAAYFGSETPIEDDSPRSFPKNGNDHSVYAICKNAAVDILEYYQIKYGFKPCVFRHFMVYGWHPSADYLLEDERKILPYRRMIRDAIAGKRLSVWGNPLVKRELLYVKDFADAVVCAVGKECCGIFNLAGVRPYTIKEQVEEIAHVFMKKEDYLVPICDITRPNAPQLLLSPVKTMRILGWKSKWSWHDALVDMRSYHLHNTFDAIWGEVQLEDRI